jgi:hypothetical protein
MLLRSWALPFLRFFLWFRRFSALVLAVFQICASSCSACGIRSSRGGEHMTAPRCSIKALVQR